MRGKRPRSLIAMATSPPLPLCLSLWAGCTVQDYSGLNCDVHLQYSRKKRAFWDAIFLRPKRSASLLRYWTNIFVSGIRNKYWSNSVWEEAALPRIRFTVKIKEENILCAAA